MAAVQYEFSCAGAERAIEALQAITDAALAAAAEAARCAHAARRAWREAQRPGIEARLAEDAARAPAFALARLAAILATIEDRDLKPDDVVFLLAGLHRYEGARGGRAAPAPGAAAAAALGYPEALQAYERARGQR
jgi:hypothetical protein